MEDNLIQFPTKANIKTKIKSKTLIPVTECVDILAQKLAEAEILKRENAELIRELAELRKYKAL